MHVLVTGGAGFIGSHLVETLVAGGHRVRVLDDFSSGVAVNLSAVARDVEIMQGDVRDPAACQRACVGVERVWHLAARCSVPLSVDDPLTNHEVNITGTLHLLLAARNAGVQRLVFASSSAVYGANPHLPAHESLQPMPLSPYAISKLSAEQYVRLFPNLYGLETVALRYFNIYGPRQMPTGAYAGAVPAFFAALRAGTAPTVYGDGEQTREFTYVADCVAATLRAGLQEGAGIVGAAFNVAADHITTVNALLATIQQTLGTDLPPRYQPERPGDIRHSSADIAAIVTRLGFHPQWSLEQGIRETARWFAG